jgi:hypothetical protein
MNKKWLLICLTGLILLTLVVACAQSAATPVVEEPQEVDVEALIIERCDDCHSADRVFQADYSQEEWSEVFDDMIQKGAKVNDEEKEIMIDWLVSQ